MRAVFLLASLRLSPPAPVTRGYSGGGLACGFLTAQIAQTVLGANEALRPIAPSHMVPSCTYLSKNRSVNLVMMSEGTGEYNAITANGWCQAHPSPGCAALATKFATSKNPQQMYAIIRQAFGRTATPVPGLRYPALLGPDKKVYVGTKGAVMIFQVREWTGPAPPSNPRLYVSLPDRAIQAAHLVVH